MITTILINLSRPLDGWRRQKATLLCLHTFTFTMTGGGVDEAARVSRVGVRVLDIPKVNYLRNVKYVNFDDGFKFWWLLQWDP